MAQMQQFLVYCFNFGLKVTQALSYHASIVDNWQPDTDDFIAIIPQCNVRQMKR